MQRFFIERFALPVYAMVLDAILNFGETGLPISTRVYNKFLMATVFRSRGWQWVDPNNEVKAAVESRKGRMSSLTSQLAEQGLDFEEVAEQIAEEDKLLQKLGIAIDTVTQ
jgi:capsid protein